MEFANSEDYQIFLFSYYVLLQSVCYPASFYMYIAFSSSLFACIAGFHFQKHAMGRSKLRASTNSKGEVVGKKLISFVPIPQTLPSPPFLLIHVPLLPSFCPPQACSFAFSKIERKCLLRRLPRCIIFEFVYYLDPVVTECSDKAKLRKYCL